MQASKGSVVWFVVGIILFSGFISWASSSLNDKTTLRDMVENYQAPQTGNAITGYTPTLEDETGWSVFSAPGKLFSIIIGILSLAWTILTTFFTGLNALLVLPTLLPDFMQDIIVWIEITVATLLILAFVHGDK